MNQNVASHDDILPIPVAHSEPCPVGSTITLSLKRLLRSPERREYQVISGGYLKESDGLQESSSYLFETGELFFTKDQEQRKVCLYKVIESRNRDKPYELLDVLALEDKKSETERERIDKIFAFGATKLVLMTICAGLVLTVVVKFFSETFQSIISYLPIILDKAGTGLPLAGVLAYILVCGVLAFTLGKNDSSVIKPLLIFGAIPLLAVPLMYAVTLSIPILLIAAFVLVVWGVFRLFLSASTQQGDPLYQGNLYGIYELSVQQANQLGFGAKVLENSSLLVASKGSWDDIEKLMPGSGEAS